MSPKTTDFVLSFAFAVNIIHLLAYFLIFLALTRVCLRPGRAADIAGSALLRLIAGSPIDGCSLLASRAAGCEDIAVRREYLPALVFFFSCDSLKLLFLSASVLQP